MKQIELASLDPRGHVCGVELCRSSPYREGKKEAPLQPLGDMQKVTGVHDSAPSGGIRDPSKNSLPFC